ncbi:MAG: PrgI family protein [Clostridiales bacterium]|nr:PrgI family protein [Clostridiales bacterium]
MPKDLSKVKNKIIGGLTKRQLIGILCAFALGLPAYLFLNRISDDLALFAMFLIAFPILFTAMFERDGMPAEEWLKNWIKFRILSDGHVKYKKPSLAAEDVLRRKKEQYRSRIRESGEEAQKSKKRLPYFVLSLEKKETILTVVRDAFDKQWKRFRKIHNDPKSVQEYLGYKEMLPDGLCRVDSNHYSITIAFEDINYQLSSEDAKSYIFTGYCSFLNSFDETVQIQLSCFNYLSDSSGVLKLIDIELRDDEFNFLREETQDMLKDQIQKGNSGLVRKKFITLSIEAANVEKARRRLKQIEGDCLENLRVLAVRARTLNGLERLEVMHLALNDSGRPFKLDWDRCRELSLRTQDFIAPAQISFEDKRRFKIGSKYAQCQHLLITTEDLSDRMLADFLDMESEQLVSMHIHPVNQQKAVKSIKKKISDLNKMKIEEQERPEAAARHLCLRAGA